MDKYLAVTRDPRMAGRYWSRDKLPASTILQVSRLSNPCFLIEVDLVAVVVEQAQSGGAVVHYRGAKWELPGGLSEGGG